MLFLHSKRPKKVGRKRGLHHICILFLLASSCATGSATIGSASSQQKQNVRIPKINSKIFRSKPYFPKVNLKFPPSKPYFLLENLQRLSGFQNLVWGAHCRRGFEDLSFRSVLKAVKVTVPDGCFLSGSSGTLQLCFWCCREKLSGNPGHM